MSFISGKKYIPVSPEEAVSIVKSGDNVFMHTAAAAPQVLSKALAERGKELKDVKIYHMHVEGDAPYADESLSKSFRVNNMFVGKNMRAAVNEGRADFIPIFFSDVPFLLKSRTIDLDVAMLQISPPDRNGFCTLGVSVDTSLAAAQSAKRLIAEINPNMPKSRGDGNIHISKFEKVVEVDYPVPPLKVSSPNEIETRIGNHVASLVDDGATLQMGIGAIPNAALAAMENHKELGVHTELFSDGVMKLFEKGVITNEHKVRHRHHIITGFIAGSQRLYDWVDDNPIIRVKDIQYVNDTAIIRQNPKVTAINSAIEIDLTGQVCADSIGTSIFSGVGGQMDFIRGAALSKGGKPIIALPSVTRKGISRIESVLKPGAGVVTTRAHVQYVVTEYGIANLYGQNLRKRAQMLINIAHPDHRERLEKEAFERLNIKAW
jgi:4-hydroxybutyrate CoA-transferase